jgi:RNA polymerase sigma-70 factor (ECF subfamily)
MEIGTVQSPIEKLLCSAVFGRRHPVEPSDLEREVTALFDDMRKPVLRYLSSFGLSPDDSEEVVQEVFCSLFLHLRAAKPRSNLRGWVFRVAHNLGLKRRETARRNIRVMLPATDCCLESQLDKAPNPEEQMSNLQRRMRLLAVVNALPEQDRRCLYLRAEGLTYRDIGSVLGMSLGGVAVSLKRSLSRLAEGNGR